MRTSLCLLLILAPCLLQAAFDSCCVRKKVGGISYSLLDATNPQAKTKGCLTDCLYEREDQPGSKICFSSGPMQPECLAPALPVNLSLPEDWQESWQQVSGLVQPPPPGLLQVQWLKGVSVAPNETTSVKVVTKRPRLRWAADPKEFYTVMILDGGIKRLLPSQYVHWMVTNIPGDKVDQGSEVMQYVTPFSKENNADGSFITDPLLSAHLMIILVFKQPGPMIVNETQAGCSPDIVTSRIHDYRDLVNKYSLELVAGNFVQVPWSGIHTEKMLCRMTKCTKVPFPFPIPGVNDLPECLPETRVLDCTIRGPKLAGTNMTDYARAVSLFSVVSLTSATIDTFPVISTGQGKEFTAIQGAYNGAPVFSNNQAETLEGIVDAAFFFYRSPNASRTFFGNADFFNALLPSLFPHMNFFKILLSQPEDQDFDLELIKKPGMVFEIDMVNVTVGREEDFQNIRNQVIAMTRSNKNIISMTKFNTTQHNSILEGSMFFSDATNNEMTVSVFKNMAAREIFLSDMEKATELFTAFTDTFECIMCATMTDDLRPEYYGPFQ